MSTIAHYFVSKQEAFSSKADHRKPVFLKTALPRNGIFSQISLMLWPSIDDSNVFTSGDARSAPLVGRCAAGLG